MNKWIASKFEGAVWPEVLAIFLLFVAISQDGAGVIIKNADLHKIVWVVLYFGAAILLSLIHI